MENEVVLTENREQDQTEPVLPEINEQIESIDASELQDVQTTEALEPKQNDEASQEDHEAENKSSEEAEEVIVKIAGERDQKKEENAGLLNPLRKQLRQKEKLITDLESRLHALERVNKIEENSLPLDEPNYLDFVHLDNAQDEFAKKMREYTQAKIQQEEKQNSAQRIEQDQKREIEEKKLSYEKAKLDIKGIDFEDSENLVSTKFNNEQLAVLLYTPRPAELVAALAKYPKYLDELSKVTNPIEFSIKLGELSSKVSTTKSRAIPPSVKANQGNSQPLHAEGDLKGTESALIEEFYKTGDNTKLFEFYKKNQRI